MMKDSKVLKEELLQGKYESLFLDIYQDENEAKRQNTRYAQAVEKFEELFGEKQVEVYSAPGRSEVGGNIQTISTGWCWLHPSIWMP